MEAIKRCASAVLVAWFVTSDSFAVGVCIPPRTLDIVEGFSRWRGADQVNDGLFLDLIELGDDENKLLGFVRRYGLLFHRTEECRDRGEPLEDLRKKALLTASLFHLLKEAYTKTDVRGSLDLSKLDFVSVPCGVRLRPDDRGFEFVIAPSSLVDAIRLQMLAYFTQDDIRFCRECGKPFRVGKGGNRSKRARFCSDDHKVNWHNKQKAVERLEQENNGGA